MASPKKPSLVLVGAGGHAKVLADIIDAAGQLSLIGATDSKPTGQVARASGLKILGGDERLPGLRAKGVLNAAVGLGSIGKTAARKRLRHHLLALGFRTPTLAHPSAVISRRAKVSPGAQIMAGAVINPGADIGPGAVVNTAAVVEHDCSLGPDCFVGPGAVLGGGVVIGAGAFIGLGARVRPSTVIGPGAIVGAGAVVVKDVRAGAIVVGVPARERRRS